MGEHDFYNNCTLRPQSAKGRCTFVCVEVNVDFYYMSISWLVDRARAPVSSAFVK